MNIYVENSKTNVVNLKEVWLSKGYDLIFNPEDLAAVFNGDEKMIREFIDKCNGNVSENGSVHFKNIESAIEFENKMKNEYSDVLIMKKMCDEEVPTFDYCDYKKPGVFDVFESIWVIPILSGLAFAVITMAYTLKDFVH